VAHCADVHIAFSLVQACYHNRHNNHNKTYGIFKTKKATMTTTTDISNGRQVIIIKVQNIPIQTSLRWI